MSDVILKVELLRKKKTIDLSEIIESVKYSRSTKKDNQADIHVKQEFAGNFIDSDDLVSGATIRLQYGWPDKMGKVRYLEIVDSVPSFGERVKLKVIARDIGHPMKKNNSNTIWKGKTASDIAIAIAGKYKLTPVVDKTTRVREDEPQANKSDFEILRQLAKEEGGYVFFINDKKLYFIKRKYNKAPIASYTYLDGKILSFDPQVKESQQDVASNQTTVIGIDPMTGETNTAKSDGKKDATLGKKGIALYNQYGDEVGNRPAEDVTGASRVVPDASGNPDSMKDKANSMQQDANDNVVTAKFNIIGNPHLEIDELMTVLGVGKRWSGNWYLSEITDDIAAGGYFKTTGEVTRDGTGKPVKEGATDNANVNDKTGSDKTPKKEIPRYDENGIEVKTTHGSSGTF